MGTFTVCWGNRLEDMATTMFSTLFDADLDDPLKPCCIVTNSNIMEAWLHHHFVFDWDRRHDRILANCSFQLLYPFINDWMNELLIPAAEKPTRRIAKLHPYSIQSLQWRIYKLLKTCGLTSDILKPLSAYLGDNPSDQRRFQLAGRLAVLFDDYQVYRCKELQAWSEKENPSDWQQTLWKMLLDENDKSYAALFAEMKSAKPAVLKTTFNDTYRRIAVFGTTAMPVPYLSFLQDIMAPIVDVDLYLMNPSQEHWFESQTEKTIERKREALIMQDHPLKDDPLMLPDTGHPLLCSLGQALQEHLDLVHQQVDGVNQEDWSESDAGSMLSDLQNSIRANATGETIQEMKGDDHSIRIHICHNPRREVEVLHNHLLQWFTDDELEPRQILVLVTDMDTYAPLIDAVFGSTPPKAKAAIPYEIEGRPSLDETRLQNAFHGILHIATSRFQAPEMLDLLENDAITKAIGLNDEERSAITTLISKAGIRWGIDSAHREAVAEVAMEPFTTWEYGLQRLLTGYALGSEDAISVGDEDAVTLLPVDAAEGASAESLGKLVYFMQRLKHFRTALQHSRKPAAWETTLMELLDAFFVPTNENHSEIATLRTAILGIVPLTKVAKLEHDELPFDVIADFLEKSISARPKQESLTHNAVIFGQLRPMNSRPAEVICLLGLVDGAFPRRDNRPTFDLLKQTRHRGDRSIRRDDRCAFLEAILCARQSLFISYAGRSDTSPAHTPPSIVVQELKDYLRDRYNLKEDDATKLLPIETLHRMQGFNADYFLKKPHRFSYSTVDLAVAKKLAEKAQPASGNEKSKEGKEEATPNLPSNNVQNNEQPAETDDKITKLTLAALIEFFKNPAKSYYRNVLDIALDIRDDGIAEGDEPLSLGTLEKYQEQDALIKTLKTQNFDETKIDRQAIIQQAKANAHSPLGPAGDEKMEEIIDNTLVWLNAVPKKPESLQMPLKDLLGQARTSENMELPLGSTVLTGTIEHFAIGAEAMQAMARPADIKTKDRIVAWISHLFACANGRPMHTLIIGNDANKATSEYYQPIDAEQAKTHLSTLAQWYKKGQQGVIDFTPETAYAYAATYAKNQKQANATGDQTRPFEDPKQKASAEWNSTNEEHGRKEDMDAWMFHAFGEDGPMERPGFINIAIGVFGPLLQNLADVNEADKNSDAGGE